MRDTYDDLFSIIAPIAIAVVVAIFGIVLYCLVRFRRRDDAYPRQTRGKPLVELVYALALVGVATFIILVTIDAEDETDRLAASPPVRIEVTAFRWGWEFAYPGSDVRIVGDSRDVPELVVPAATTIQFSLSSRDVIHAFWVPDERFKRDAFPGRVSRFDLRFDEPGTQVGRCAEFCGLDHAYMDFGVRVLEARDFNAWLASQSGVAR